MIQYTRKVEHPTSVKKISVIKEPTDNEFGIADFETQPVFSVFDYGTIQPSIPLDNSTITLMAAHNFELLKEKGIDSHYLSLVMPDGSPISAKDAIKKGYAPNTIRVKFANRIMPEFVNKTENEKGHWDYSMFGQEGKSAYVQPIEFISRNDLPESSSVWKRVAKGQTTMEDLGLPADFKPGDKINPSLIPILDYSTKFEPDDRYLTPEQARILMNVSPEFFEKINASTRNASILMTDYAASRGFDRLDGKVEYVGDILGDAVCTWHEDRLVTNGLGISKQRIRAKVKQLNKEWYNEIETAKDRALAEGVEDFRTLMNPEIVYVSPKPEFFEAVNNLFRAGTNQWVDKKVYDIYSSKNETLVDNLHRAIEDFNRVK